MHSDQMRKDGISEPMIHKPYIMTLLPTMSRPGCTVHVMCSVKVVILSLVKVHECMQKFIC